MDNFCHTLVGAACGEAGLKHRTRYGNATLMIAANLPDIDVLSFLTDTAPISFRRGWTHGILAQLLLPIAFTGVMYAAGRLLARRRAPREDERHGGGPPLHAGWLLLLSYVGVYSHVFLDFLNNYGVRLLSPFDWRWFYGDAAFIADVWMWLALGVGVWLTRRQRLPLVPGRQAYFASPEDVILYKLLYHRQVESGMHVRDILGIIRVSGAELDEGYIAEWADRLGLRALWDRIRKQAN